MLEDLDDSTNFVSLELKDVLGIMLDTTALEFVALFILLGELNLSEYKVSRIGFARNKDLRLLFSLFPDNQFV